MGYPIKYTVESVKARVNFGVSGIDYDIGYIVSKCFVIESRESYRHFYDTPFEEYVVCLPYDDFISFVKWYKNNNNQEEYEPYHEKRRKPSKESLREGYPIHVVYKLFDSYEEAKKEADIKNANLKEDIHECAYNLCLNTDQMDAKFEEYQIMCKEYEKYITDNTENLIITMDKYKYLYSKDSELISQLMEEFVYDETIRRQILEKYDALKKENEKKLVRRR